MSRVQSIDRAFLVLEAICSADMGVTDLASRVGMPKSTVARIVNTLLDIGAVERVGDTSTYRIGPKIYSLATERSRVAGLVYRAAPHLRMLASELGEDAGLSVPDGNRIHYVAQEDADNNITVRDWTGTLLPLHVVPSGLVILAHWPSKQLSSYLQGDLARYTANTVTDPDLVRKRLKQVHEKRHAWGIEEFAEGISSVASPIYDRDSRILGAIHVHGPSYRFPGDVDPDGIAAKVTEVAGRISRKPD